MNGIIVSVFSVVCSSAHCWRPSEPNRGGRFDVDGWKTTSRGNPAHTHTHTHSCTYIDEYANVQSVSTDSIARAAFTDTARTRQTRLIALFVHLRTEREMFGRSKKKKLHSVYLEANRIHGHDLMEIRWHRGARRLATMWSKRRGAVMHFEL